MQQYKAEIVSFTRFLASARFDCLNVMFTPELPEVLAALDERRRFLIGKL